MAKYIYKDGRPVLDEREQEQVALSPLSQNKFWSQDRYKEGIPLSAGEKSAAVSPASSGAAGAAAGGSAGGAIGVGASVLLNYLAAKAAERRRREDKQEDALRAAATGQIEANREKINALRMSLL